jgi:hypothetical protein
VVGLVSFGLVAGGPATAQAPQVPSDEDANIVEPFGDANFIHETNIPGAGHNNTFPVSPSTVGDLGNIWFTHDERTVSAHINTFRPGPATTSIQYQVFTSPGEGSVGSNAVGCLRWIALIPGQFQGQNTTYHGDPHIRLVDRCNDGPSGISNGVDGEYEIVEGPEGTGILTMTFPRDYSPLLADGQILSSPRANSVLTAGVGGTTFTNSPVIDDTDPELGKDYEIASLGPPQKKARGPKPKKDPPGQAVRQCNRFKNKKRRQQCKRRARQRARGQRGCSPYVPGEMGADVEEPTTVITDAATEEEPIEMEFAFGPAAGNIGVDTTDEAFHNIQVDSKAKEVGLWVRLESPVTDDPDLYVYWDNGTVAAQATGFNQAPFGPLDGTGNGGHSGIGYEQIDGIGTADCTGYTLRLLNWLGFGGTYTLKLWLGDIENEARPRE